MPTVAMCLTRGAMQRFDAETETLIPTTGAVFDVAHALRGEGFDASEDGTGRGTPLVPVCFDETQITSAANYSNPKAGDPCHPLAAGARPPAIAFTAKDYGGDAMEECSPTLRSGGHADSHANAGVMPAVAFPAELSGTQYASSEDVSPALSVGHTMGVATNWRVRRLTPRECERLQAFPDDWTCIPWRGKPAENCPDGPRYKATGNSMATNVMSWIGERIAAVGALSNRSAAA